jgi:uncharacterized protein YeaO (DUF488 family)
MPGILQHAFNHDGTNAFRPRRRGKIGRQRPESGKSAPGIGAIPSGAVSSSQLKKGNAPVVLFAYAKLAKPRRNAMTKQKATVALKRVYDESAPGDGTRVLVERLWPRGLSRERAHIDLWLKEIAPSRELRTWFGHDPEKFAEFRRRYEDELASQAGQAALTKLRDLARQGPVTLVFAARDTQHSNAAVLRDLLLQGA